ncbi:MAG: DNA adenine methylase [Gammaproteobacteria bacterium]
MPRPLKVRGYKPSAPKKVTPKEKRSVTPLLYYGGKSRDAAWIVSHFPPHRTFVDVFGGGGSITFYKYPSWLDVYNDIGNVVNFFKVLRDYGDELYEALWNTPYSREEFYSCRVKWEVLSDLFLSDNWTDTWQDRVEWARCWFVTIIQGYAHEESPRSPWKPSKTLDLAFGWNNRVEALPHFTDRLRGVVIENLDFMKVIDMYDSPDTLFYLDPPYTYESREAHNNYQNELPFDRHVKMLDRLQTIKGQAVVSMYSSKTYEEKLSDWKRDSITHKSAVQNSASMANGRGDRTEVIWIKEHQYGLFTPYPESEEQANITPDISREEESVN